jgi:predicted dehydrogenase
VGSEGVVSWDYETGQATLESAERRQRYWPSSDFERNEMFLSETEHMLRCLSGEENLICDLEDGIQTLRVCLAAKESSQEGRRVHV